MLLLFVVFPFIAAIGVGLLPPKQRRLSWLVGLIPALLFVQFVAQFSTVTGGTVIRESYSWVPALNLHLSFALDGLSLLFALLITGIGTLITVYASNYLKSERRMWQFQSFLLVFMGAMLGLVLSDNLLGLFVFWELTSVSSYLLVGFEHRSPVARSAARMALAITGGGGLALLGGAILLGQIVGSYEIPAIIAAHAQIQSSPLFGAALTLVLLGAFTKSAQFPFHFWLPGAMAAPTPASAYLHSATMVKAGIYLLARLSPALGDNDVWRYTLMGFGLGTLLLGSAFAFVQYDLKALLAYTTLAQLGAMVALIGIGHEASKALVVTILGHALYKASLFMASGSIQHATHTRDLRKLGGLMRIMPWTSAAVWIAAFSMAGLPPLFGFLAKEKQLEAFLDSGLSADLTNLTVAVVGLSALLTVAVSLRFAWASVGRPRPEAYSIKPHEGEPLLVGGPLLLAILSLLLVFVPPIELLLGAATSVFTGKNEPVPLAGALWHGVTPTLIISIVAIVLGVVLFAVRRSVIPVLLRARLPLGGADLFERTLALVTSTGAFVGRRIEMLSLRGNLIIVFVSMIALVGWSIMAWTPLNIPALDATQMPIHEVIVILLIPISAVATVFAPTRLMAITALGITGAMVSLIFVLYSAPDLAITQLLIETLSLVFMLIAFARLPRKLVEHLSLSIRLRDVSIAVLLGLVVMGLTVLTMGPSGFPSIYPYYVENSYPLAHGKNIVNVILVDFRGFDTLGEVTVLCTAALGAYAVLRLARKRTNQELLGSPDLHNDGTPIDTNKATLPPRTPLERRLPTLPNQRDEVAHAQSNKRPEQSLQNDMT